MSRAPAFLLAPIALVQGRALQRSTPRMPPASPRSGGSQAPDARRLLVLGDSTAVGTGVEQMTDAMAGQIARRLESVAWRAVGENGATAREVRERHLAEALIERADIVVVLVGWNDALRLRPAAEFRENLVVMLDALHLRNPDARRVLVAPPRFSRFKTLPQPLRFALGAHARGLTKVAAQVAADRRVPLVPGFDGAQVAVDGFHPNSAGYSGIAERVCAAID